MKNLITLLSILISSISYASTDGFVKYISFTRTQFVGTTVPINVTIRSEGTSKEMYKCNLYFSTDSILDNSDIKIGSFQTQGIYGYDTEKNEYEIETTNLLPGTYYLIGAIDELNEVIENDESNNVLFEALNLVEENYEQKIDRITSSSSNDNFHSVGGSSAFTIWSSNIGSTSAAAPTYGQFSISTYFSTDSIFDNQDYYITDLTDYVSRVNSSTYATFNTIIPNSFNGNDSIYLIGIIDSKNELALNDKSNDTLYYKVHLKELSPLISQSFSRYGIQYTSNSAYSGNNLTMLNVGTEETNVTFDFYISEDEILDGSDHLCKSVPSTFAPARMTYSNRVEIALDFDLSDYNLPEGNYTIYSVVKSDKGLNDTIFFRLNYRTEFRTDFEFEAAGIEVSKTECGDTLDFYAYIMGSWFDHSEDTFDLSIRVYLSENHNLDAGDSRVIDYIHHSPEDGYPYLPYDNVVVPTDWTYDSLYVIFILNEDKTIDEDYYFNNISYSGLIMEGMCSETVNTEKILSQTSLNNLYPNPVENKFSIVITAEHTLLTIVNISGEIVFEKNLPLGINQLDISQLSNGIYITRLSSDGDILQSKLIKR